MKIELNDNSSIKELQIMSKDTGNKTVKDYVKESHNTAKSKGFYERERNIGELLMLIVSELSEALEAHRKDNFYSNITIDEKVQLKRKLGEEYELVFDNFCKDTFEFEIADTFIRLFDLCGYLNIDIEKYIQMTLERNSKRAHKHNKRY